MLKAGVAEAKPMSFLVVIRQRLLGWEFPDRLPITTIANEPNQFENFVLDARVLERNTSFNVVDGVLAGLQCLVLIPSNEDLYVDLLAYNALSLGKLRPLRERTLPADLVVTAVTDCKVLDGLSAYKTRGERLLSSVLSRFHR